MWEGHFPPTITKMPKLPSLSETAMNKKIDCKKGKKKL